MTEHYHKWYSQYISSEFEMLVFGHSGYPVILFPQSKGRYYDYKDHGLINKVGHLLRSGSIKLYCPDSIDRASWYNYSIHPADRVRTHIAYENLILNDVIGFAKFETNFDEVAVAGCGFGGFHAANLSFRHPDKVSHLICVNSFFNIKRFIMGHYDDDCYFNNPPDYLPGLNEAYFLDKFREMDIVFGMEKNNPNIQENEIVANMLRSKEVTPIMTVEDMDCNSIFNKYLSRISAVNFKDG